MAAFLPSHLYHAHYVTNETCLALLVSASIYLMLRLTRDGVNEPRRSATRMMGIATILGLVTGAALLTKITALILLPVLLTCLLVHVLVHTDRGWQAWLTFTLVPFSVCVIICGWYYAPLLAGGGPFAEAGWWGYGTGWWQQDGFRTPTYYLRFGQVFVHPIFSGFYSYWDGMYSTFWGDALCGSTVANHMRPPWNYQLLAFGYWLGVLPTGIVILGGAAALSRGLHCQPRWFLLSSLVILFGIASILFSLLAPGTSQVRASFGLMLLLPLSALFANGLRSCGHPAWQLVSVLLVWCALTSVVAHWIPSSSAQAHFLMANLHLRTGNLKEATRHAEAAWHADPSKGIARSIVADVWNQSGRTSDARQMIEQAVQIYPNDPIAHLDLGFELAKENRIAEALVATERALALAPHHAAAARQLVVLWCRVGNVERALLECRNALRLAPHDPKLQEWLTTLNAGRLPTL